MTPKESTMAVQASTERIRAVREEIADMPELNNECEYCGESDGHDPDCRFDLAGCESCNNLEAFRGARFCRDCQTARDEAEHGRISVSLAKSFSRSK